MEHTVLAKQHVGSTFLVQDLLLPEENEDRPNFLINLSRDRINIFDVYSFREVKIDGLYNRFSDYYEDFDANSNLNSVSRGGLNAGFHGHRSKSEEQQKDQAIYYQYLNRELTEIHNRKGYSFVLAGLPEALDVYLNKYHDKGYIHGIMYESLLNLSHQELSERVDGYRQIERIADIQRIKHDVEEAKQQNHLLDNLSRIEAAIRDRDVKSLISFNDGNSYSIDHNKLLIQSLLNRIHCRVLYSPEDQNYPSMNAIVY